MNLFLRLLHLNYFPLFEEFAFDAVPVLKLLLFYVFPGPPLLHLFVLLVV